MARPSQSLDLALLRSGLSLYPESGCAGLSVRRVAEHAGVTPAMLHYHFGSKSAFLRAVLQQVYDQMFARLSASGTGDGPVQGRLRRALFTMAVFLRDHQTLVARLAVDAASGEPVVHEFLRSNAPRHLGLLTALLDEAERDGLIAVRPTLQRFVFVFGAVAAPLVLVPALLRLGVAPPPLAAAAPADVLSDRAIQERIELALAALGLPAESPVGWEVT